MHIAIPLTFYSNRLLYYTIKYSTGYGIVGFEITRNPQDPIVCHGRDDIAKDMQSILDLVAENFQSNIHLILCEAVNLSEAKEKMSKYTSNFNFNLLQGLHSHSAQLQYFRKHFNLVVSLFILY